MYEEAEEAYWSLYDLVGETILDVIEKEISLQEDLLDATEEANDRLVSKLQEQIDEDREARENEKAEENLANLQS